MARQNQDTAPSDSATTAPSAQTAVGQQQAPAQQDAYAAPSGFRGFDAYFNANAGAAKATANKVAQGVQKTGDAANDALAQAYGAYQGQVQSGYQQGRSVQGRGQYGGPTQFDPSALYGQFHDAEQQRDALGSEGGIQALIGPGASRFSAALTAQAGQPVFDRLRKQYAGLDAALGGAQQRGSDAAASAAHASDIAYQQDRAEALSNLTRERMRNYGGGDSSSLAPQRDFTDAEIDTVQGAEVPVSDDWYGRGY